MDPPPRHPQTNVLASAEERIACLLIPELPLAAELRAHPELCGKPVAVAVGQGPRAEILAASPEAIRSGVRIRQTVVHARAACAALEVRRSSPTLEQSALQALRDAALSTSPRVEQAPPASGPYLAEAAVFADARGTAALFRSERGFAGALQERAARLGLHGVVAVAASRGVARIAARRLVHGPRAIRARPDSPERLGQDPNRRERSRTASGAEHRAQRGEAERSRTTAEATVLVLDPGGDAAFLAPLPLDLLNPEDGLAEAFTRFGLRRVADLTRIPERQLVTRFGRRIVPLLKLARGEDRAPPPSAPESTRFEESQDLEVPVSNLEPLLFVLRGMLSRLGERLECRGLAAGDLQLQLGLEGGGRDARSIGVAAPTTDPRIGLRLLGLSLESRPPPHAVDSVRLSTDGQPVRGDQLDFFRPPGPPPAVLDRTLAELAALCGPGRVGAPRLADSHRPDACATAPFRPRSGAPPAQRPDPAHTDGAGMLAIRALRPPVPAQVRTRRGVPEWVRSPLANGEVVRVAGPWRTTGHWWSEEERFAFDHFDVQTADGMVVRLRLDHVTRGWQIDGYYD